MSSSKPLSIAVLGAGRVGAVIAAELASDKNPFIVSVADVSERALSNPILSLVADKILLKGDDSSILESCIERHDLVLNCVPGFIGYKTLEQIIRLKRPCIDISFFPERHEPLDELAKQFGVEAWFDMGLAPGMSSIVARKLADYGTEKGTQCQDLDIFVGGLPVERTFPLQYKAVFSPSDVIDEYLRPSRIKRGGETVVVAPLTEPEYLEFEGVGTIEAFITDGLRSLVEFLDVPNMREMTLRYPGHKEVMWTLRELGFFDRNEVMTRDGISASPLAVTEAILGKSWNLGEKEIDRTLFLTRARYSNGETKEVRMLDEKDLHTGYSSMARTTGFVAVAVAEFFCRQMKILGPGVYAPERLPESPAALEYLLSALREKGVHYVGVPQ